MTNQSAGRVTAAVFIALLVGLPAHAQPSMESWSEMRGEVVRARELIGADVTNGFNPVGNVTDLILSQDGSGVQYVLYEVPYPYSVFGAEDGFAAYDRIAIEAGTSFDIDVRLEGNEAAQAPEELTVTREQAEERLASRLIGESMRFDDGSMREIEDILIDRDTGALTHYVVETDEDSIFRAERRTVPADMVMIDEQGSLSANLPLTELAGAQDYDPALL